MQPRRGSAGRGRKKKVVIIEEVLEDGDVVRYERGKLLGKGGFATCYELRDTANDEVCAAKVVSKKGLSEALRTQLQEEISLHALATDGAGHLNVLQFYSSFEDDKSVYLLLEVARHGTLMDVVAARTRLTEPECQYWMPQLFAGLDHLDSLGVVHRDLTLNNLFIDREGRQLILRIADFGLAEMLIDGAETAPNCCGTPSYMPPEVLRNSQIVGHEVVATNGGHSHASDLWAAGICLYSLLVGRTPFETNEVEVIYRRIKAGQYSWPGHLPIGADAVNLVTRLLASEPADRPTAAAAGAHPFVAGVGRPQFLPLSTLKMCPKFDVNGRIDVQASKAAEKGHKSSASAYGAPLKLASTNRTKAKPPRQCVLGPEERGGGAAAMSEATRLLDGLGGGGFNEHRLDRFLSAEAAIERGVHVGDIGTRGGGGGGKGGGGGDAWQQAEAAAAELERMQAEPLWANWGGHGEGEEAAAATAAAAGADTATPAGDLGLDIFVQAGVRNPGVKRGGNVVGHGGKRRGRGRGRGGGRGSGSGRGAASRSSMAAAYGGGGSKSRPKGRRRAG
jgi:serine/threonine protein kinase